MVKRHIVKTGESLWSIASATLGDGKQWPRLWRYNNRPAVIKVTKNGIPDPDTILPGQLLLIPLLPHTRVTGHQTGHLALPAQQMPTGLPSGAPTGQPLRELSSRSSGPSPWSLLDKQSPISIKYRLDDLTFPPIIQPGVIMEIRMTGDILLMSKKAYPAVYVTQRREIEAQVVTQGNDAFKSLVNDTRLIYDLKTNTLAFRSMLVTRSTIPNVPTSAVGIQIDSKSPLPKLRFEFRFPKIEGSLPLFNYTAVDIKIVVELTPTPMPQQPTTPTAEPMRAPQSSTNWDKVFGTGLLVTAGVLVVGTLVEDFFTAGAGAVDDPVSFATAGASVTRGLQLIRGTAVVLQSASIPAALTLSFALSTSGGSGGEIQSGR
jgi:hypothetical protein